MMPGILERLHRRDFLQPLAQAETAPHGRQPANIRRTFSAASSNSPETG